MRRIWAALLLIIPGCPSLDGFVGDQRDAGSLEASTDALVETTIDSGNPGAGYLPLADAARFCTLVLICPHLAESTIASMLIPVQTSNYSSCVDWIAGPLPADRPGIQQQAKALACAAQASSCAEANACMLLEIISADDPRCTGVDAGDGGTFGSCSPDGDSVYYCSSNYILHCDNPYYFPGSTCLLNKDNQYWCAVAGTCSGAAKCTGTQLTYCGSSGQTFGIDCAVSGESCGFDPDANITDCLVNGVYAKCGDNAITCEGTNARICHNGYLTDYECAPLGGTCMASPSAHCVRPADECDPNDPSIDVCTGDTISLCVGGRKKDFDCAGIGKKCVPAAGSLSAHCE